MKIKSQAKSKSSLSALVLMLGASAFASDSLKAAIAPNAAQEAERRVAVLGSGGYDSKNNEAIVVVYLRRKEQISDGIISYINGKDMLLPLQELMILLEFAIEETPNGARGWFLSEKRKFSLDIAKKRVVSDGRRFKLKSGEFKKVDDELYVSARSLSRWLPLDFRADLKRLALHIFPREDVPRERRRARSGKEFGSVRTFRSSLPRYHNEFALWQIPSMETDLYSGYNENDGGRFYSGGTVRLFGDFLYMNGEVMITGNQDKITNGFLRFGRKDPDGGLLGGLNATEWAIGDVGSPGAALVSTNLAGRGARITSRPASFVAEFDRITLEDALPPNYEVELYRNNILIASQRAGSEGRYSFKDVQLFRGQNELRLEIYGPHGERRTETKNYFAGGGQVPVGQFNYDLSVHEIGKSVMGFDHNLTFDNSYGKNAVGGAARFDYGLTRFMSITAGVVATPLNNKEAAANGGDYRVYGTLGARTQLAGIGISLDSAADDTGGIALGIAAQSSLASGWSVSARHEQYLNGYVSARSSNNTSDTKLSDSKFRLDKVFTVLPGVNGSFGLSSGYATYELNDGRWSIGNSLQVSSGFISLSNSLSYSTQNGGAGDYISGSASLNLRMPYGTSLRGSTAYNMDSGAGINSYSAGFSAPMPFDTSLNLGYSKTLADQNLVLNSYDSENYYVSLKRDFGLFELGARASQSQSSAPLIDNNFSAVLTLSFSTFTDQETLATIVTSDPIARSGAMRPLAFYDHNKNGVRDPGEELLEGAKVLYSGARQPYYTGYEKSLPTDPLSTGGWVDVALDKSGFDDPALSPGNKGVAVLPRPGVVSNVELPVISTAGVEGTVSMRVGGKKRRMPNVMVQVVRKEADGKETVVAQVATEFDGLFSLSEVPVGTYLLRVDPQQAKNIGVKKAGSRKITLTHRTAILENSNIELIR